MKDQSEDVMNYRDRVNRSEVEVAQESFQRHFPSKTGNPWVPDQILEALSDFGIKAQSRTEKLALNVVLSEQETDEFGFNHFCSIIEEARCKLRAARAHTVFQAWKYADKEDVGALSTEAVLKLLEDLNLAFQKGTLERHYVEAMVQDCHTDPVTGLVGLPEVEFLVSAVREFMVQCQRRTERELQVQYELSDLMFHQPFGAIELDPEDQEHPNVGGFRSQLIRFHEPRPKPPVQSADSVTSERRADSEGSFKELDDDDSGVLDPNEAGIGRRSLGAQ
ncbi:unnamed protein product [Effrenium voratum]|nr:unnamed protein product [Effrenium voratum]